MQVSAYDLTIIATALEKPISYFFPPRFRGAEESDLSPDEKELIHFYRQLGHEALQIYALKQITTLAESAIQADLEVIRREAEEARLEKGEKDQQ